MDVVAVPLYRALAKAFPASEPLLQGVSSAFAARSLPRLVLTCWFLDCLHVHVGVACRKAQLRCHNACAWKAV